jgi:hypothetical protein
VAFLPRRFQHLYKKKRFPRRNSGVKGSSSSEKKDGLKAFFNCTEHGHFVVECLKLQKQKPKKESSKKENFKNKVKKSLTAT